MLKTPEIDAQLKRILASEAFATSARSAQFLEFCVLRVLSGRTLEIKETTIGVELFHRPADYDPKTDSIVRVHARRVREKLQLYYRTEGADDSIRIELPKGRYVPQISSVQPRRTEMASDFDSNSVNFAHDALPDVYSRSESLLFVTGNSPAFTQLQRGGRRNRGLLGLAMFIVALMSFTSAWVWRGDLAQSSESIGESIPLEPISHDPSAPAWSPDGKRLAYTASEMPEGKRDIYLKSADCNSVAVRLTHGAAVEGRPVWSPDDANLAFVRATGSHRFEIVRLHLADGSMHRLGSFTGLMGSGERPVLDWSPDGRYLLTAAQASPLAPRQLVLISAATGEQTMLASPIGPSGDLDAYFSPDSQWVVFRRGSGGDYYSLAVSSKSPGEPTRLTFNSEGLAE